MIDINYGDKIVLMNGEIGIMDGFMGRGRNALWIRLKPSPDGTPRADIVYEKDIRLIIKKETEEWV